MTVAKGEARFTAYLDRSSVEAFGDSGQVSITDLIYPSASATGVGTYVVGGTAKAIDITITPMKP